MSLVDLISQWPAIVVYVIVAVLVSVESVGVPLPGETSVIAGVLLAQRHGSPETPMGIFVAAVVGGVVGDSVGYLIGHHYGHRLLAWLHHRWPNQFTTARIEYSRYLFQQHGMWAVFFGRFVALVRMLSGVLSGSLHLAYRRFLVANVSAVIVWAGMITLLTVWLGQAASGVLKSLGWVILAVVLLIIILTARWVRKTFDRRATQYAKRAAHG